MPPARKPSKPAKAPTPREEARRTNVLLEKLSAEFRAFGEGLSGVRAKLESTFDQVGRNTETIGEIKDRLIAIEKDTSELKNDVKDIKEKLETFNQRLVALELR